MQAWQSVDQITHYYQILTWLRAKRRETVNVWMTESTCKTFSIYWHSGLNTKKSQWSKSPAMGTVQDGEYPI